MITQASNLQNFINNHLRDIVDWKKHVLVATDLTLKDKIERELQRETTSDQAHVVICTEYNRYYLASISVYVDPPFGAPVECRTLGTIMFQTLTSDPPIKYIRPRQDQTFIDIAKAIRKSELSACIADVRRQLAECDNPDHKKVLLGRVPALAAKAKELGLENVNLPVPASDSTMPNVGVGEAINQAIDARNNMQRAMVDQQHVVATPVPEELYVGCPIIYITNPGEAISGQRDIPGLVNKVYSGDTVGGVFFPDHSEVMHKDNLVRRSDRVQCNCWDYNPGYARLLAKIAEFDPSKGALRQSVVKELTDTYSERLTKMERGLEEAVVAKAVHDDIERLASRIAELDQATKMVVDAELKPLRERIDKLNDLVLELATRPAKTADESTDRPKKR